MKKLTVLSALIIAIFLGSAGVVNSSDLIRSLTNGKCSTNECFRVYNIRSLTNGKCSTNECFRIYNIRSLTNGKCSTNECLKKQTNKSLGLPENYAGSHGARRRSYNYDVSGYGDSGYVTGYIDATSGSRLVEGTLTLEDGTDVSFDGEWVGKGEVEVTDENGNSYSLDVD